MFYRKNEDGSVLDYSLSKYADDCLYTEEAIVESWNGIPYLESECPQMPKELLEARIQKQLTDAVQRVLDNKAQELNYDSCLSVCSYVDTGVPKFDSESSAFRKWRSAVWQTCYQILDDCQNGVREIPTTETLISELPPLVINYEIE